ncbi:type I polyketide synthase [Kineosporia babensis]|uniref:SDR family oxidoreductase n=1 Tax=Kineosporia babensis TaxID=499548 RepID=A0A9X1NNI9_9ACTN|nr:type I polyketide synthase [Kineosporia babensis]MCD5316401.1 SDR family oxidoreductase [Kineosporia babensis]
MHQPVIATTPLEHPDGRLLAAITATGALGVLDLGRHAPSARRALAEARTWHSGPLTVRLPCALGLDGSWPTEVERVIAPIETALQEDLFKSLTVLAEVTDGEQARTAIAAGAAGLIVRGNESGGAVGELSTFVLLQQVLDLAAHQQVPVWAAGGIGPHTAAAVIAGGGAGVVLDTQLALLAESDLPDRDPLVARLLRGMDGTESRVRAGHRVVARVRTPEAELAALDQAAVLERLGGALLPIGQDAYLAAQFADDYGTVARTISAVRASIEAVPDAAPLDPEVLGTSVGVAQGPMTRVSDQPAFAAAVSAGGALPFIALALADGPRSVELLSQTAELIPDAPWGAGILGFVPDDLRAVQLEAIRQARPSHVIIAGGRPAQAAALEQEGIATFLHVPSPILLEQFLRSGARRFVLEGAECGGHVGPRNSFPLWEAQIQVLLSNLDSIDGSGQATVLFAGGIHDERSAAMIAALAAPLVRRGVRVGLLMGSAYLFTAEAVATAAVHDVFQQQVLAATSTALLETAPGHSTRCVVSPFTAEFERVRSERRRQQVAEQQIWAELEDLNVGRLRIAAKALRRTSDGLVPVAEPEQVDQGLFMAGQVSVLRSSATTIAQLHWEVSVGAAEFLHNRQAELVELSKSELTADSDVAIVGMACVFPDAPDLGTYWSNVLAGHDAVREVPLERWDPDVYWDPTGDSETTTPSKWGGFIPRTPFDALRYGIPPSALSSIEPVQLLALDVARQALDDAFGERPYQRERTSVVFGAESGSDLASATVLRATLPAYYGKVPGGLDEQLPGLTADSFPGMLANVISGRIANRLDLGGSNFIVDAACASSLAALDIARKELITGSSDVVVCGGADLHNGIGDYLLFSSVHALSPSGRSRPFSADADGIGLGEGVACVVLKRRADAERDGDRIYAVIKGVGSASDGRSLGLTAPRREGQKAALERAYTDAGLPPAEVGLLEAHGTGTVVGDRTELNALTEVFLEAGAQPAAATLGSVKSLIGHTKCAAGLAGLIKAALAVSTGILPPSGTMERPNPAWSPTTSPFTFSTRARPWGAAGSQRLAGVSAFGFGGTNFHTVLAGAETAPARTGWPHWPAELLVLRGPDDDTVRADLAWLNDLLDIDEKAGRPWPLRDVMAAAAQRTALRSGPVRVAIVAGGLDELRTLVARALAGESDAVAGLHTWDPQEQENGKVAFLYPGQGSQRPHAFGQLLAAFPELQRFLPLAGEHPQTMFPAAAFDERTAADQLAAVTDTRVAQPALGIAGLVVSDLLAKVGVRPDLAGGHSYGELVALHAAGVLDAATLMQLSRARAEAISQVAGDLPGGMAAVALDGRRTAELLAELQVPGTVTVANLNHPRQTVIAGPADAIEWAVTQIREGGHSARPLNVAGAFHSPALAGAGDLFAQTLAEAPIGEPTIDVFANRTAGVYPAGAEAIRAELARQIASPVRFAEQIEAMYQAGARIFVETGPGRVLSGFVDAVLADRPHRTVTVRPGRNAELTEFLQALAQLAVAGVPVNTAPLYRGRATALPAEPSTWRRPGWIVDGQLVRTANGDLLPGGLRPAQRLPEPTLTQTHSGAPAPVPAPGQNEQLIAEFIRTSREMLAAQRDVLLTHLGATSVAPPAPVAPIAPAPALPALPTPAVATPEPVTAAAPVAVDVATVVKTVISEHTGYPAEMIEPELDLESDLSIDSIKRMEIAARLVTRITPDTVPDDTQLEDLSRARTAAAITTWLTAHAGPSTPAAPEAPAAIDVAAVVKTVISEHTGYPTEMIEPELDLESDLSIDSIKRMEIAARLVTRITPDTVPDDTQLEDLSRARTAAAITTWLTAHATPSRPEPAPRGERPERYRWEAVELPALATPGAAAMAGKRVLLIGGDTGLSNALATALSALEADPVIGGPDTDPTGFDAVLYLLLTADPATPVLPEAFTDIQTVLTGKARSLLVVAGLAPGDLSGRSAAVVGMRGLIRTAAREFPETNVKLVETDELAEPGTVAQHLCAELLGHDLNPVVLRQDGQRRAPFPRRADLPALATSGAGPGDDGSAEAEALGLTRDSVILVIGGARGITSRITATLAAAGRCTFVLAGRTPPAEGPEEPFTASATTLEELRTAFVARGDLPLKEMEKTVRRILAQRELAQTLKAVQRSGSTADYRTVDVLDVDQARQLVKEVYQQYGRLDGIVYGAGVTVDQLVSRTTMSSFRLVYDTKVEGVSALLEAAAELPVPPGFAVLFGSVATVIGSRGQVGYAAANDALESICHDWAARTGSRAFTVHWGPWAPVGIHAGMVSPELERDFARRNLALIDPEQGPMCLLKELAWGAGENLSTVIWSPSGWLDA